MERVSLALAPLFTGEETREICITTFKIESLSRFVRRSSAIMIAGLFAMTTLASSIYSILLTIVDFCQADKANSSCWICLHREELSGKNDSGV